MNGSLHITYPSQVQYDELCVYVLNKLKIECYKSEKSIKTCKMMNQELFIRMIYVYVYEYI